MASLKIQVMVFTLALIKSCASLESKGSAYCEFYNEKTCGQSPEKCPEREECVVEDPASRNHCFVTWHYNPTTNKTTIKQKGCFLDGKECYDQTECVDKRGGRRKNVFFCCCSGDMCNKNFSWIEPTREPSEAPVVVEATVALPVDQSDLKLALYLSVPTLVLLILLSTCFYLKHRASKKIPNPESPPTDSKTLSNPQLLAAIQLLEVKSRGNFGTVWKAKTSNSLVAVKIFETQQEQSWQTEQEVFKLPHMKHRDLLEFIGAERRLNSELLHSELWLVTAYHEKGSLCDYLRNNVLSWEQLVKIAESMLRGLTHLHEEIPASALSPCKPAIAHRDLKSQNVLLKADLSACIADFGLSLIFHPDKPAGNTHSQVGTRRYWAPEVLQGAINFNQDSFLRIDMYACGLVLWELATRCAIHEHSEIPKYKLPFEDEAGLHPTLDDMLKVVIHEGRRPKISPAWQDHQDLLSLCDTMEECWDADPEARLSVSCVLERILNFTRPCRASSTSIWMEDGDVGKGHM